MKTSVAAAVFVAILSTNVDAQTLQASEVFRLASPSIVVIHGLGGTQDKQGSGVVIRSGVIASNCHVLETANYAVVIWQDEKHKASLVDYDVDRDLCILSAPSVSAQPARLGMSADLEVGATIYAIGAPRGLTFSLSNGLVSGKRGELLQITAPISPGSSGGGLFDDQGRLVGITTLSMQESQQINFALPVEWISELTASRSRNAPSTSNQRGDVGGTRAPKIVADAREEARTQAVIDSVVAWENRVRETDSNYEALESTLLAEAKVIRDTMPPEQWEAAIQEAYERLSGTRNTVYRCTAPEGTRVYASAYRARHSCVAVSKYSVPVAETPAPAETRWLLITDSPVRLEMDAKTVRRVGQFANVWVRATSDDAMELQLTSFDCQAGKMNSLQVDEFFPDGRFKATHEGNSTWQYITPGSLFELMKDLACSS